MDIQMWVQHAFQQQASDLHLEAGMPPILRIQGRLQRIGSPLDAQSLLDAAKRLLGQTGWSAFLHQRSHDGAYDIGGVRCRINLFQSTRGIAFAIRLLPTHIPTLAGLNLHPSLRDLASLSQGLVVISGATGSGKSSTLAALLNEINQARACHILTLEHPIEYQLPPQQALIRQREIGRDTPSFAQALLDALREDPDVIMVGEMREPECIRLTLNAAETGHLVLTTLHASNCAEALQRIVSAFSPEIQANVRAQLADCFQGVLCQRLRYHDDIDLRVPECEILRTTSGVRSMIREGHFFKLPSAIETGARDGMWSFERYRDWLDIRDQWQRPQLNRRSEATPSMPSQRPDLPPLHSTLHSPHPSPPLSRPSHTPPPRSPASPRPHAPKLIPHDEHEDDVIELDALNEDLNALIKKL